MKPEYTGTTAGFALGCITAGLGDVQGSRIED